MNAALTVLMKGFEELLRDAACERSHDRHYYETQSLTKRLFNGHARETDEGIGPLIVENPRACAAATVANVLCTKRPCGLRRDGVCRNHR